MRDAFGDMSAEADYRYMFDPFWVRADPYRHSPRAGTAEIVLHVRNFLPRPQPYRIALHRPPACPPTRRSWKASPPPPPRCISGARSRRRRQPRPAHDRPGHHAGWQAPRRVVRLHCPRRFSAFAIGLIGPKDYSGKLHRGEHTQDRAAGSVGLINAGPPACSPAPPPSSLTPPPLGDTVFPSARACLENGDRHRNGKLWRRFGASPQFRVVSVRACPEGKEPSVIYFKCKNCGALIKVSTKFAGKKGKSPAAGSTNDIPLQSEKDAIPKSVEQAAAPGGAVGAAVPPVIGAPSAGQAGQIPAAEPAAPPRQPRRPSELPLVAQQIDDLMTRLRRGGGGGGGGGLFPAVERAAYLGGVYAVLGLAP